MTPLLLAPWGLAALSALLVPLVIHLYRRTERVPIDFAALRWLAVRPRPRRRLRFDEWPLLIVRLLLIAVLALLLAEPAVQGGGDKRPQLLVARGLPAPAVDERVEARWLAPGFPAITAPAPNSRAVPTASLIRQYDAELAEGVPLTVRVPAVLKGADADRLHLSRRSRWEIVSLEVRGAASPPASAPILAVRTGAGDGLGIGYLRAAAAAWTQGGPARFSSSATTELPAAGQTLVWLRPGSVPDAVSDWVARGGTALLGSAAIVAMPAATAPLWQDATGRTIAEGAPLGRGRIIRLVRPLTPAALPELLEPDFAARLRALVAAPPPPPERVAAQDYTPIADAAPYRQPPRPLAPWIALLVAALFVLERWLATAARREAGR